MSHCTMEFTLYLHVPIQELKVFSECHDNSCARRNAFANSRSVRGHELRGETKRSRRATLCQGKNMLSQP